MWVSRSKRVPRRVLRRVLSPGGFQKVRTPPLKKITYAKNFLRNYDRVGSYLSKWTSRFIFGAGLFFGTEDGLGCFSGFPCLFSFSDFPCFLGAFILSFPRNLRVPQK